MSVRDTLSTLLVVLLWGLNFTAVKMALSELPPFFFTALRFGIVGLVLAPFARPRLEQLPHILGIALTLGVGHFGLLFFGVSGMDAATAALITQLGVPFSVLLAWGIFHERIGVSRIVGLLLAFAGIALIAGDPSHPRLWPMLIGCLSMLFWATSNIQVKRLGAIDPLVLNGWTSLLSAPMLLAVSLLIEDNQIHGLATSTVITWGGLAFSAIASSLIAYTLWYRLLARNPVSRIVPFTLLNPIVGMTGGVMIMDDPLGWHKLAGGALTIAGVAVVQIWGGNRSRTSRQKTEQPS